MAIGGRQAPETIKIRAKLAHIEAVRRRDNSVVPGLAEVLVSQDHGGELQATAFVADKNGEHTDLGRVINAMTMGEDATFEVGISVEKGFLRVNLRSVEPVESEAPPLRAVEAQG